MKKILILLICLVVLIGCDKDVKSNQSLRSENVALNATEAFLSRKDDSFYVLLSASAKNNITLNSLKEELDSITRVYGSPIEMNSELLSSEERGFETVVKVPVRYSSGWMDFEYVIDENGSIDEFKITTSDMLDESGYDEIKYSYIVDKKYEKSYVYTNPHRIGDDIPIVLMIHDKEAYDRNSTIGIQKTFRSMAYALAENGIASVRYDRVVYDDDTVDDSVELIRKEINAIISSLRKEGILTHQKLYLFGYGLGGYLVPYLADKINSFDGFMIGCAPARNLEEVWKVEQDYLIDINESYSEQTKKQRHDQVNATVETINKIKKSSDYAYKLFGYNSRFWVFAKSYDALVYVDKIDKPIFVFGGSNDYSIPSTQFNLWQAELKDEENAVIKYYKDMDHYFVERDHESNPEDIMVEGVMSRALIKDLIEFIGE